jgi:TolB-like protein/class 3 adenylate cyclase/Flp pilus assembly protein TadD
MPADVKKEIQLEIAHVLFIDIVGYSKLSINQQHAAVAELTQIVRATEQFQKAEAADRLIKIGTGDGMALVFYTSPETPVRCAMQISRALKEQPRLQIRMGIHSGPVSGVVDVTGRTNLAGAGLNLAQRVMKCGDAGHILLSKHVAEDLSEFDEWRPLLHDLGTCEVKHGVHVAVVNLWSDDVGNHQLPQTFRSLRKKRARLRLAQVAAALAIFAGIVAGSVLVSRKSPTSIAPEKSIAVLPFENRSEDKTNSYFADGVQDEILTDLARIADLKVISRTSVMHYKSGVARNLREIGQQLGVANVLEGSVQRSGNRVRVNAQLIDTRNDRHLWGQTYDRDLADVFAIQSEIAKAIADQLRAQLSPSEKKAIERPPTSDITAFDYYAHAKNLFLTAFGSSTGRADLLQAADLLNQAVTRDPSFFDAFCQLAFTDLAIYFLGWDHTPARLAQAERAVEAAVRLRPDAGETHLARARNLYFAYLDYDGALRELEMARQTIPSDPWLTASTGYIERRRGRWEESTRDLERAIELDPRNFQTIQQTATSYEYLRRYADAKSTFSRVLAFAPNDPVTKTLYAFVELDSKGDTRALHQTIDSIRTTNPAAVPSIANYWFVCAMAERHGATAQDALTASGENPITTLGFSENMIFTPSFIEAVIARMTKDDAKAEAAFAAARAEQEKIVQADPNYGPALCVLGLIDAGLGRKEEAIREGRRAVDLLPIEKDALGGVAMVKYLAMIAAWVGDKDLACEELSIAIRNPGDLSYGQLKLLPFWEPLRGDPRFERIVEEARRPVALKAK